LGALWFNVTNRGVLSVDDAPLDERANRDRVKAPDEPAADEPNAESSHA
jgi:hypothetical protein